MIDESAFPNLSIYEYRSDPTPRYNCIAFAAGVDDEWWDPAGVWPAHIGLEDTVSNLIEVYKHYAFERCNDGEPETGFDKLAIYATDDGIIYQHAARLGSDGQWLSNMGPDDDIAHPRLESLEGDKFGRAVTFMRRPVGRS
jgi:hypothetical protein